MKCCAKVQRGGWSRYDCSRDAQPDSKFCFQHEPARQEEKHQARRAKWEKESRQRELAYQRTERLARFNDAAKKALVEIAAGHNDPRELAKKTLEILDG